jgi:hypothetical protein
MKRPLDILKRSIPLMLALGCSTATMAQDSSAKKTLMLTPTYVTVNNQVQYAAVKAKTKVEKRFQPVPELTVSLYLDGSDAANLVGKVVTNAKGEAMVPIPASMQALFNAKQDHTLTASAEATKAFDATSADAAFTRSKIALDTADGRSLVATVTKLNDKKEWVPVKGVEMKIGVRRQASLLPVSADDATYTTDSLGQVTAEFKRDSLASGPNGALVLAAVVEENDELGSLSVEKTVPWGKYVAPVSNFDRRTLFATRQKTPVWLLFMAYSIIIAVWGVIVYLVRGVFRIKKLGTA